MPTLYDVNPTELIESVAQDLKKIEEINPPEWSEFVKTGSHKMRTPINDDWWYVRSAAVMRKINKLGPIGVEKLRTQYGGKPNKGLRPGTFTKGSGSIIRKVLQQLEKAGLAKQEEKDVHKGRVLTPKGQSLLDKAATKLVKK